jgi:hypothetical protein
LREASFRGFLFNGGPADSVPPASVAPLTDLSFVGCTIGPRAIQQLVAEQRQLESRAELSNDVNARPLPRIGGLECVDSRAEHPNDANAREMHRNSSIEFFSLADTVLEMPILVIMCDMLTSGACSVEFLHIGGTASGGGPCLSSDCLDYFFQRLPMMKSLASLTLKQTVPRTLSQTIVDGIKRNYVLRNVSSLTFESDAQESKDSLKSEIAAYVQANDLGRGTIVAAVANPADRNLQREALRQMATLASRNDTADNATLFLFVRLFLPSFCAYAAPQADESRPSKKPKTR